MEKKTREELIVICKECRLKGYSNKKKNELIELLNENSGNIEESKKEVS